MKTDNELIAEFMGIVFWKEIQGQKYYKVPKEHVYVNNAGLGQFRYDKSWDWLMPVVQRINKLNEGSILDSRDGQWAFEKVLNTRVNSELKFVYSACVEFIKWYNSHSPNKQ